VVLAGMGARQRPAVADRGRARLAPATAGTRGCSCWRDGLAVGAFGAGAWFAGLVIVAFMVWLVVRR
jgi:hypothetical protein